MPPVGSGIKPPSASTPIIAFELGFLLGALGLGLAYYVSPWALLLLIPAAIEFKEGIEGVPRNQREAPLPFWLSVIHPAAHETEDVSKLLPTYPGLALHEYSHQLTGKMNFFPKHILAVFAVLAHLWHWILHFFQRPGDGGGTSGGGTLNAEQSRFALALEKLRAVSPFAELLGNRISQAAKSAFHNDAEALIKERQRLAAERSVRASA